MEENEQEIKHTYKPLFQKQLSKQNVPSLLFRGFDIYFFDKSTTFTRDHISTLTYLKKKNLLSLIDSWEK